MKRASAFALSLLLLAFSGTISLSAAQQSQQDFDAGKTSREQTFRLLNQLHVSEVRASAALEIPGSERAKTSAAKTAWGERAKTSTLAVAGGAIAGTLFGLNADDVTRVSVTAWAADSSAGTVTAYFGTVGSDGTYRIVDVEPTRTLIPAVYRTDNPAKNGLNDPAGKPLPPHSSTMSGKGRLA